MPSTKCRPSWIGYAARHLLRLFTDPSKTMTPFIAESCVTKLFITYSLVYTEAVLMETLRLSSVVPFTLMHCAMNDTKLQGYSVPKVKRFKKKSK